MQNFFFVIDFRAHKGNDVWIPLQSLEKRDLVDITVDSVLVEVAKFHSLQRVRLQIGTKHFENFATSAPSNHFKFHVGSAFNLEKDDAK